MFSTFVRLNVFPQTFYAKLFMFSSSMSSQTVLEVFVRFSLSYGSFVGNLTINTLGNIEANLSLILIVMPNDERREKHILHINCDGTSPTAMRRGLSALA